jgi:hypothetical protein
MSRAELAAMLARYDDEAWLALASAGLLRRARKDLAALEIRLSAETDAAVEIAIGDRTVRMGADGPAGAACSCPSVVICQHIITAGLWLASASAGAPGQPAVSPDADQLYDDLMRIDAAALTAHAGLPGYRWAHDMLGDQQTPPGVTRTSYLSIIFERPPLTVRYLGGGIDGLVLDESVAQPARFQVAAVLAWQRAHGLVLPQPPPPRSKARGESESSLSRTESRTRLRATVAALLRDTVAIGVSHLSPAIHERLTTAATWAQGVEYHRLALLLRRLADQTDLLLARSALADDLILLDEIALTHALVAALDAAAASGTEPATLVGQARTAYDTVRSLDLIGLGGRPWRTGSGYHGLTCLFWSPSRREFLTWTDARPQSLAGFDPRARWLQPAPWTGLPTPAAAAGHRLALTHARVSPDGRISGVQSTAAAVAAPSTGELTSLLPVQSSWRDLAPAQIRGLSDAARPASHWAVLSPAQARPPNWDSANQTLRHALLDADGEELSLEVPWSRLHAHVIERLEGLGGKLPAGALVVARVTGRRGRLTGEPLSLVLPARDLNPVDALHFDDGPQRPPSMLVERLLRSGAPDIPDASTGQPRPDAVPVQLADLRALIEAEAQRGCSGLAPGVIQDRVARAHRALRVVGLSVFAVPDQALGPAETLLRSLYLVQLVEQALA